MSGRGRGHALLALVVVVVAGALGCRTSPSAASRRAADAFDVLAQFDRLARLDLWPGFRPGATPLALFDGERTILLRHSAPAPEFRPVESHPSALVMSGRHPAVAANAPVELGGQLVAGYLLDGRQHRSARQLAAGVLHEAFHVFQRERHPNWTANEVDLFDYPFEDAEALALRRLEDAHLRRALGAREPAALRCEAAAALRIRRRRFERLPPAAVAYERTSELNEGLASYVEHAALGDDRAALPDSAFEPELVRERSYAVGDALARILDRLDGDWKAAVERGEPAFLDETLASAVEDQPVDSCEPTAAELSEARRKAAEDVAALRDRREGRRAAFGARPGWRVEVDATAIPLMPRGFDPLNVLLLGDGEVLHGRWLQLTNSVGEIEVLGGEALTEGVGPHALFNGVRRVTITGLTEEPIVAARDGKLELSAETLRGTLRGEVERREGVVAIRLVPPE